MTFFTDEPVTRDRTLEEADIGAGDFLEAVFGEGLFTNPLKSTARSDELNTALTGEAGAFSAREGFTTAGDETLEPLPVSEIVTRESALERAAQSNLELEIPPQGIPSDALDLLIERGVEQRERQAIMERYDGAGKLPLALAAGLAASLIDPLNIAAGFVPIVGTGRYARMIAQAGTKTEKAKVRAKVGAVEGAVGTAIIEPLPLLAAQQDQTDYTMADSLLNILFGTVLGGGLHAAAGAFGDARALKAEAARVSASTPARVFRDDVNFTAAQRAEARPTTISQVNDLKADLEAVNENITVVETPDRVSMRVRVEDDDQFQKIVDLVDDRLESTAEVRLSPDNNETITEIAMRMDNGEVASLEIAMPTPAKLRPRRVVEEPEEGVIVPGRTPRNGGQPNTDTPSRNTAENEAQGVSDDIADSNPERTVSNMGDDIADVITAARVAPPTVRDAPETVRNLAARAAIAQAATGRPVDVADVFEGRVRDPSARETPDTVNLPEQKANEDLPDLEAEIANIEARNASQPLESDELRTAEEAIARGDLNETAYLEGATCLKRIV